MQGKISKRSVDALKPGEKDIFLWDTELRGFGVKCTSKGRRVYLLQYRQHGRLRRYTIGKHSDPWTPTQARQEAARLLGLIAEGEDPAEIKQDAKKGITVAELCKLYLDEGCTTKKPSTVATDRGRIERHIIPLLGRMRVDKVKRADVQRFMNDVATGKTMADVKTGKFGRARVSGGKGTATRTVGLLGGIMSFAVERGYIEHSPVLGVKRFPDKKNERFLSEAELARLGRVLAEAEQEGTNPCAIAAVRLLLLTGCRRGEILGLRWTEVDFNRACLRLDDSKTGQKVVPLGAPALEVLDSIPRVQGSPFVLPASKGSGHFVGLPKIWQRIRERADLPGVRLHDARHSFASVGASGGMSLPIVGKLLGHASPGTTARYAHLSDDPVRAAADQISGDIAAAMGGKKGGEVIPIKRKG